MDYHNDIDGLKTQMTGDNGEGDSLVVSVVCIRPLLGVSESSKNRSPVLALDALVYLQDPRIWRFHQETLFAENKNIILLISSLQLLDN